MNSQVFQLFHNGLGLLDLFFHVSLQPLESFNNRRLKSIAKVGVNFIEFVVNGFETFYQGCLQRFLDTIGNTFTNTFVDFIQCSNDSFGVFLLRSLESFCFRFFSFKFLVALNDAPLEAFFVGTPLISPQGEQEKANDTVNGGLKQCSQTIQHANHLLEHFHGRAFRVL